MAYVQYGTANWRASDNKPETLWKYRKKNCKNQERITNLVYNKTTLLLNEWKIEVSDIFLDFFHLLGDKRLHNIVYLSLFKFCKSVCL